MTKTCLGIDIGKNHLKLVLMKGETVLKCATVQMPDGLYKDGRVVSVESMGELLRNAMKEHRMHCKDAAIILPPDACYLRNITMPEMDRNQMMYNIPFEFKDYITEELKDYAFDYVEHAKTEQGIDILAAAVSLKTIEDMRLIVRKAGLRLSIAIPEVTACEAVMYRYLKDHPELEKEKEYGILDVGSTTSSLMIFNGYHQIATRTVDLGIERAEELLADAKNIDIHLAHTWLMTNHEDCVHSDVCQDAFAQISIEIMRALNFYRFSNPSSNLDEIMVCGNDVIAETIKQRLQENVEANVVDAGCLLQGMSSFGEEKVSSVYLQAVGVALNAGITTKDKLINVAYAGVEKKRYAIAVPALIAILVGATAFGKFAVADRLLEVSRQKSQTADVQEQVEAATEYIANAGDIEEEYAHYTYQGYTSDELLYVDRAQVLELMKEVVNSNVKVGSWSLEGNQLTLPVTGNTLADINALLQELEEKDIVDYCTMSTAVTKSAETGTSQASDEVTGQITVYLQTASSDETKSSAEADGTSESAGTDDTQQTTGGTDE